MPICFFLFLLLLALTFFLDGSIIFFFDFDFAFDLFFWAPVQVVYCLVPVLRVKQGSYAFLAIITNISILFDIVYYSRTIFSIYRFACLRHWFHDSFYCSIFVSPDHFRIWCRLDIQTVRIHIIDLHNNPSTGIWSLLDGNLRFWFCR